MDTTQTNKCPGADMSWTACYKDECWVHQRDKEGAYFPKAPRNRSPVGPSEWDQQFEKQPPKGPKGWDHPRRSRKSERGRKWGLPARARPEEEGGKKAKELQERVEELLKEREMLLAERNINGRTITKLLTEKKANTETLAKQ